MSIWHAMWGSDGRISRTTFWLSTLVLWVTGLAVWLLVLGPIDPKSTPFDDLVRMAERAGLMTSIVLLYPSVVVAIKRLHDLGATGWWCVPLFVPGFVSGFLSLAEAAELVEQAAMMASFAVTLVYFVTLGFIRGTKGPNHCGHDPRTVIQAVAPASARTARRQPPNPRGQVQKAVARKRAAKVALRA